LSEGGIAVCFRVEKNYFDKYGNYFEVHIGTQEICCNTQSKLLELINCKYEGINKKIHHESVFLYLLNQVQKNNFVFQLECTNCSILNSPLQIDMIKKAKSYILENLSKNLTIPLISTQVGTNQCYLKKGFKEVYNQTIYDFIRENRMIKSKYLIENSSHSMTDISVMAGYSSLSSFSQAYKSYFGVPPTEHSK
jgi:AraC-like DNA-binding protein